MTRRRDQQRGAILPIMLGAIVLMCSLMYGGFTLLRVVVARHEVQRAADAAVLIAANIIKHEGLPFDALKQGRAEETARKNSGLALDIRWEPLAETPDKVEVVCHVSAKVQAPTFIFGSGNIEVVGTAHAAAGQKTLTESEKKYPRLVLVLDLSGSMTAGLGGNPNPPVNQDSYHILLRAVNMLLDFNFDIKYGVVMFASSTLATISVSLGSIGEVRAVVNDSYGCPYGTNGCMTGSAAALRAAHDLLEPNPDGEAGYVMFVSDGAPTIDLHGNQGNSAFTDATNEANRLWDQGTTIFTLHVVNATGQVATNLKNFMISISGKPEHRHDPGFYVDAASEDKMKEEFAKFGGLIACQIGPLTPAPPHPEKMHVFIRAGGGEETALLDSTRTEGVPPAHDESELWSKDFPFKNGNYFFYDAAKAVIFVTPPICDRVTDLHEPVIVRYAAPLLTD